VLNGIHLWKYPGKPGLHLMFGSGKLKHSLWIGCDSRRRTRGGWWWGGGGYHT